MLREAPAQRGYKLQWFCCCFVWPREKYARGGRQTHILVMSSEAIKQLQQYAQHPRHSHIFQRRRFRFRKALRSRRRRCVPNGSQRNTRRAAGKRSGRRRGCHTLFELRQYIILGVRRRLLRGAPPPWLLSRPPARERESNGGGGAGGGVYRGRGGRNKQKQRAHRRAHLSSSGRLSIC